MKPLVHVRSFIVVILSLSSVASAQTNFIGSAQTSPFSGINSIHSKQSECVVSGFLSDFYDEAVVKGQNEGVGVHTWLTTDFTNDDYCDLFLSFLRDLGFFI